MWILALGVLAAAELATQGARFSVLSGFFVTIFFGFLRVCFGVQPDLFGLRLHQGLLGCQSCGSRG